MNRELIRQHLKGATSYTIRTSDGKEFRVPHADFVLIGQHNLVIEQPSGYLDIIDPLHVVSIRPKGSRKTGKSRK